MNPASAKKYLFTLHFATINTTVVSAKNFATFSFTLHFATINTARVPLNSFTNDDLHYTLLLLIH